MSGAMRVTAAAETYFGKYRGRVENNRDPLQLGRVQVSVPDVLGLERTSWAMPCVPYAGPNVGLFALPPVGANVWVEFECGDPDYPVWTGCFWSAGQVPSLSAARKVLKTQAATLTFDDTPGAERVTIETRKGLKIAFDLTGIEISAGPKGRIKVGKASVAINGDALEVM